MSSLVNRLIVLVTCWPGGFKVAMMSRVVVVLRVLLNWASA
jgi:hypothetical protein